MFPGQPLVRRKRTADMDTPGRPVRLMVCPVGRDARVPSPRPRPPTARAGEAVSPNPEASPRTPKGLPEPRSVSPTLRAKQAPRREAGDSRVPDKQTHRWPPDGQSAPPGQRCDPADPPLPELHIARAPKCQGPIHADTAALGVIRHTAARPGDDPPGSPAPPAKAMKPREHAKTSELEYVRTSARLRTPRRCWRECARAH